jgi:hypothetical protein
MLSGDEYGDDRLRIPVQSQFKVFFCYVVQVSLYCRLGLVVSSRLVDSVDLDDLGFLLILCAR